MAAAGPRPLAGLLAVVLWAGGCAAPDGPPGGPGHWVDLTWAYSEQTLVWPTSDRFALEVLSAERTAAGYWYAANRFSMAEHGGTHMDAPIHFSESGVTADRVPLERLTGPAVLVDVSARVGDDGDALVGVEDLSSWEARHGAIEAGTIVLLRTGWGERWPDATRYLGTDRRGSEGVAALRFPGLHPQGAEWLVARGVAAVGIDTASIDRGRSTRFAAHVVLARAQVPVFENVARLGELPPRGAWVAALPMKIEGGSGGPVRIVAHVPGAAAPAFAPPADP